VHSPPTGSLTPADREGDLSPHNQDDPGVVPDGLRRSWGILGPRFESRPPNPPPNPVLRLQSLSRWIDPRAFRYSHPSDTQPMACLLNRGKIPKPAQAMELRS
jgi:hypothetical protein